MAEIPSDGNCGIKGNELLTNPNCTTKFIDGDLAYQFTLGNCEYIDGEILIKETE